MILIQRCEFTNVTRQKGISLRVCLSQCLHFTSDYLNLLEKKPSLSAYGDRPYVINIVSEPERRRKSDTPL